MTTYTEKIGPPPSTTRESIVDSLFASAHGLAADIILKGSVIRGDRPFGDIDLLIIGDNPDIAPSLPTTIENIEVSVSQTDKATLFSYAANSPRAWYMFGESLFVNSYDPSVAKLFEERVGEIVNNQLPDYLFYLFVEHNVYSGRQDLGGTDYYSIKRQPGSKRSIMRGLFIAKALKPEYYLLEDTQALLDNLQDNGDISHETVKSIRAVQTMLLAGEYNSPAWQFHTAKVEAWQANQLKQAKQIATANLPTSYVSATLLALHGHLDTEAIQLISSVRERLSHHRQWVLDLAVAANATTPREDLADLWKQSYGNYEKRVICRFLVRNPSFPKSLINQEDIHEYHLGRALARIGLLQKAEQ